MKNPYIGNIAQLGGTRSYELTDGWARGMRATDVDTGSGLRYSVLPDRGMDISLASFRGINLAFLTFNGETAPTYYNPDGVEWLRGFAAGLLTTCGLNSVSAPCIDEEGTVGLHGRYAYTPARRFADLSGWEDDRYVCRLRGSMEYGRLFGEKMTLEREIVSVCGENKIRITDTITNSGTASVPFCMLYHFNLGYPLLSEKAMLKLDSVQVDTPDAYSAEHRSELHSFIPPQPQFVEQLFFHTLKEGYAALYNPELGMELSLRFDAAQLPYLSQWKMMGYGEYVLGLEPGNVPSRPRNWLRERGMLPRLDPSESRTHTLEIALENR